MRLQLQGIGKRFGAERALHRVDLALAAGSVSVMVGGRGSGKSTLTAILAGILKPDAGRLLLDGRPFDPRTPHEARRAGVSVLLAGPALAPHLTAAENLALGMEPARCGWINRARRNELAQRALTALQSEDIPLDIPAELLSASQQRRVEIVRTLMGRPRMVVIDDPGPLAEVDLRNLFAILRARAREGTAVLLLTRSLEVARELGGHTLLLREGGIVASERADRLDRARALALLEGSEPGALCRRRAHRVGGRVLELRGVSTARLPGPVDLVLHQGEIFGVAGLPGSGRSALLRAIFGLDPLTSGILEGIPQRMGMVGDKGAEGGEGLLPCRSVAENLTLSRLAGFGILGWFSCEKRTMAALDWMEKLHIQGARPSQPVGELSCGNRRKVAVGRLLQSRARLLLLDEPVSGIDAASRERIYGWIAELVSEGRSIVVATPSFPELLALCDTVGVMRRGRMTEVRPARDWTLAEMIPATSGVLNRRFTPSL